MKFILLLRPINLVIIALTMYITKIYIVEALMSGSFMFENIGDIYDLPKDYDFNFFLLVMMMVSLAAGGYILNDYFDVRADRINKPNKTYIDYHISRKTAIIAHLAFTFIGICLSIYLWTATGKSVFTTIAFSIGLLLWIYSVFLKKHFLIGNLLIAALTGIVPYVSYLYFTDFLTQFENTSLDYIMGPLTFKLLPRYDAIVFVGIFCVIAFLLNLVREIIKDIQDIVGDRRVGAKTIPIVIGVTATKIIASFLIIVTVSIFTFPFTMWPKTMGIQVIFIPFITIICLLILTLILMILAREKGKYKYAIFTLKLTMLFGLFLPVIINSGINDF